MTYLAIILVSFLVVFIFVRFAKWSIPLYLLLGAGVILGIGVAFFNLNLGIQISIWSVCLMAAMFLLFYISSIISLVVSFLVLGPVTMVWLAVKTSRLLNAFQKKDKKSK